MRSTNHFNFTSFLFTLFLLFTAAFAAKKPTCSNTDISLLERRVADTSYFCKYYNSRRRTISPVPGFTVKRLRQACLCIEPSAKINNVPRPIGKPAFAKSKTCAVKRQNDIKASFAKPKAFCDFYRLHARRNSPIDGLTVKQVHNGCACFYKSSTQPNPSTTSRIPGSDSSSSAAAPKATLERYTPDGANSNNPVALKPANASDLYFAGNNPNSTTKTVAKINVELAYKSVNLDHSTLVSSAMCNNGGNTMIIKFNDQAGFTVSRTAWAADPMIVLISGDSTCDPTASNENLFLAKSFTFNAKDLTATATGGMQKLADLMKNLEINFGQMEVTSQANVTAKPYVIDCGVQATSANVTSFASAQCGADFDADLDAAMGFFSGADADIDTVFAQFAPGSSSGALAARGWFKSFTSAISNVVKVVAPVIQKVATVVAPLLPPAASAAVVKTANTVSNTLNTIANKVDAFGNAVENALSVGVSKTFDVPINITPPSFFMVNDTPWGRQAKIITIKGSKKSKREALPTVSNSQALQSKVKSQSKGKTLAVSPNPAHPKSAALTVEKGGKGESENAAEGTMTFYCVDCGITGSLAMTGVLKVSPFGVTDAYLDFNGKLSAGVFLGIVAEGTVSRTYTKPLVSVGIPGLTVPNMVTIGPELALEFEATISLSATAELLMGGRFTWPAINGRASLMGGSSFVNGFQNYNLEKKFELSATITAEASLGLPVSVNFGVSILGGKYRLSAGIKDTPAIALTGTVSIVVNGNGLQWKDGDCMGVTWALLIRNTVALVAQVAAKEFEKELYKIEKQLAGGCLGKIYTAPPPAPTTTPLLIPVIPVTTKAATTSPLVPAVTTKATTPVITTKPTSSSASKTTTTSSSSVSSACYAGPTYALNSNIWEISTTKDYGGSNHTWIYSGSMAACIKACDALGSGCFAAVFVQGSLAATDCYMNGPGATASVMADLSPAKGFSAIRSTKCVVSNSVSSSSITKASSSTATTTTAATTTTVAALLAPTGTTQISSNCFYDGQSYWVTSSTIDRTAKTSGDLLSRDVTSSADACWQLCSSWGSVCQASVWVQKGQAQQYCYQVANYNSGPMPSYVTGLSAIRSDTCNV